MGRSVRGNKREDERQCGQGRTTLTANSYN